MEKIFETTLDIGGKDSFLFKEINKKLLNLAFAYKSYCKKSLKVQKYPLSSLVKTFTEDTSVIQTAFHESCEFPQEANKLQPLGTYFCLESDKIFVNAGLYLLIPYTGTKPLKIRLADNYIPRGYYPKVKFETNGKKWLVNLKSSKNEKFYRIKKFKRESLDIILQDDGSFIIGEREFPSILENDKVQSIYNLYREKKREYNTEKAFPTGKKKSELLTDLRGILTLKRRYMDFVRCNYLAIIHDLVKCCPKTLHFSSRATSNSFKVGSDVLITLLRQASSLYGITFKEDRIKF